MEIKSHWEERKNYNYYKEVVSLIKKYAPVGKSILDVGGADCKYLLWMDSFSTRISIDLVRYPPIPGIQRITGDFLTHSFHDFFDVVLCLQVLEHVPNPDAFCSKLFTLGKTIVISVPYRWEKGFKGHLHDPVDEKKLRLWTKRDYVESRIADDTRLRLISVYKNKEKA